VVVIDEAGRFVIPMLSGHLGGANALAGTLAAALDATAVLTTASDARQTLAVDLLGRELGWAFDASHDEIVRASAAMVNDEPVAFVQEAGSPDWWRGHANGRSGPLPANLHPSAASRTWTSPASAPCCGSATGAARRTRRRLPASASSTGRRWRHEPAHRHRPRLRPRHAGRHPRVGAGRGPRRCGAALVDVAAVASIDLKADEPGLLELARWQGWTIRFYPAAELATVPVPHRPRPSANTPARRRSPRPPRCSPRAPAWTS
jgi:cobalt-precorrin 5A hydrolase